MTDTAFVDELFLNPYSKFAWSLFL